MPGALDPEADPSARLIEDPEILEAFSAAAAQAEPPKRVAEMLANDAATIWWPKTVDALAATPVEEFYQAFKSHSGDTLGNPSHRLWPAARATAT